MKGELYIILVLAIILLAAFLLFWLTMKWDDEKEKQKEAAKAKEKESAVDIFSEGSKADAQKKIDDINSGDVEHDFNSSLDILHNLAKK